MRALVRASRVERSSDTLVWAASYAVRKDQLSDRLGQPFQFVGAGGPRPARVQQPVRVAYGRLWATAPCLRRHLCRRPSVTV